MWRTILLIQRYSTVARTVGIPNPNRPLLSGAGHKRNCACWQIASFYFCLRSTTTHEICKEIYGFTPEGTDISYDYLFKYTPVVERQFLRGGHRLARLLNEIYR